MDDRRHFAFVAVKQVPGAPLVANAMLAVEPGDASAEFGIIVARGEAGQRLGTHLLDCLIREGRGHGCESIYGLILADNAEMIDLAQRLGFGIACDLQDPGCVRATLHLRPTP
jgi:RimJ/RimL family protein N-acetyltransferase